MSKKLARNFYTRPALTVAKDLLGKFVVRRWHEGKIIGKIVETEAYIGPHDKAAHSFNWRKTKRNEVEYLSGGRIYIYLVYGMYWQFNITTGFDGQPECVLIRALEPINTPSPRMRGGSRRGVEKSGKYHFITTPPPAPPRPRRGGCYIVPNGPGKLCQYLKVDKSFYGEDLAKSKKIWLENDGGRIKKDEIVAAERIGIDYAGEWARKPWRFYLRGSLLVSKR